MLYWSVFFFLMALGYFVAGAFLSFRDNKVVSVRIINKDGTIEEKEITLGRDPQVDRLIARLKSEQKAKRL